MQTASSHTQGEGKDETRLSKGELHTSWPAGSVNAFFQTITWTNFWKMIWFFQPDDLVKWKTKTETERDRERKGNIRWSFSWPQFNLQYLWIPKKRLLGVKCPLIVYLKTFKVGLAKLQSTASTSPVTQTSIWEWSWVQSYQCCRENIPSLHIVTWDGNCLWLLQHIYTHMHIHTCTHMHTSIYAHTCMCMYTHIEKYTNINFINSSSFLSHAMITSWSNHYPQGQCLWDFRSYVSQLLRASQLSRYLAQLYQKLPRYSAQPWLCPTLSPLRHRYSGSCCMTESLLPGAQKVGI